MKKVWYEGIGTTLHPVYGPLHHGWNEFEENVADTLLGFGLVTLTPPQSEFDKKKLSKTRLSETMGIKNQEGE